MEYGVKRIMGNRTNYHSHTQFCDGRADMEDFVREAVAQGFASYGFSPHAPLPFHTRWTMRDRDSVGDYLAEFRRLKDKYADAIELYAGMEIDYLNEDSNPSSDFFQQLPLDYRIGSVHLLYDPEGRVVDVDCGEEAFKAMVDTHFEGDLEQVVRTYYARLMRMVSLGGFDIVGHADKMSNNASFCRPGIRGGKWYGDIMQQYFELIAEKGLMVEINTKQYHRFGVFYPNQRYFKLLRDLKIPLVVNSDAHETHLIDSGRQEALRMLSQAGIRTVVELEKGVWTEREIRTF